MPESLRFSCKPVGALAGDMSCYWNWSLSGPFGAASDSSRELSHYPDGVRCSKQG